MSNEDKWMLWVCLGLMFILLLIGYTLGRESVNCEYHYSVPEPEVILIQQCTVEQAHSICQREWIEATRRIN
jgi:hypothetical protein